MSRLIDADALMEGYKQMGYDPTEHPEESYMEGWCKGFNAAVDHCIHHVIHAPTIEPQRMRGKWTKDNACEFCGFHPWYERNINTLSFCPNCGADMRGTE